MQITLWKILPSANRLIPYLVASMGLFIEHHMKLLTLYRVKVLEFWQRARKKE